MRKSIRLERKEAVQRDQADPLAAFRPRFLIADPGLIYMDGNSLGRLTLQSAARIQEATSIEWGQELIRAWNQTWWDAPRRTGEKIAGLVGAAPGQVIVCDSTSINLFKLTLSALALLPDRQTILTDTFNFPSDLYILQGCVKLLGGRHKIVRIGSRDGEITPDLEALSRAINQDTALVTLSHVAFKSGFRYDMAEITRLAHRQGALVLWDLCHSVGALPVDLDRWEVDFAVGCTYKYLNGGPGSPAFLYVRRDLQDRAASPVWGWWGQKSPFDFSKDYTPAEGINRFYVGTAPILSLLAMEAALDTVISAGLANLYQKSQQMTEYLIDLFDAQLSPLGFELGTPREAEQRGSHVSLRHPQGYRINRALIEEMNVLPDFREPNNLRFGLAPLYNSFTEIWDGMDRLRRVVAEKRFEKYSPERQTVT